MKKFVSILLALAMTAALPVQNPQFVEILDGTAAELLPDSANPPVVLRQVEGLRSGVTVCLGTDGAMWNNSSDIFREMKGMALLSQKPSEQTP